MRLPCGLDALKSKFICKIRLTVYTVSMRVISLNLNGIHSAAKKGAFNWLAEQNADFICFQEVRASFKHQSNMPFKLPGYFCFFNHAEKQGYSGVAIYSKHQPVNVVNTLGWSVADTEGRYIELQFNNFSIASLYMPSGTSGEARQALKYEFMTHYTPILREIIKSKKSFIITGDINIAHKNIDIKNWRGNQKSSGFLPEERAWLDKVFDEIGFVDAFRVLNKEPDQYTWWSNFSHARDRNVGWRIDYQLITPDLKNKVNAVSIYNGQRFSDHAPLIVDYSIAVNSNGIA